MQAQEAVALASEQYIARALRFNVAKAHAGAGARDRPKRPIEKYLGGANP